jgi:hypothetical protein
MVKTNLNKGYVTQIIGPVLDIEFLMEFTTYLQCN